MIYELRTYEAAPGRIQALDDRFRDLTLGVLERLGFRPLGFWRAEEPDRIVYVLSWNDRAEAETKWAEFAADEEWRAGKTASEADGPLLAKASNEFWTPTSFSALR